MTTKPGAGSPLRVEDVADILEIIETRKHNFPEEPLDITLPVVLFNLGDRFAKVWCITCGWSGFKLELPMTYNGVPRCPNGHVMMQGKGMRLGWIDDG
jgi:hypothetical protein